MVEWIQDHIAAIAIGAVVIVVAVLVTLACVHHNEQGTLVSKEWVRTINIEKYDWVHHSREGSTAPDGAINIKRWTEAEHYTTTSTDSKGKTSTTSHVRFVDHISYDVQEWQFSRQVQNKGSGTEIPNWPQYTLGATPQEREGDRAEQYTVTLKIEDDTKTFHPDYAQYNDMMIDRKFDCVINGFGTVVKVNFN